MKKVDDLHVGEKIELLIDENGTNMRYLSKIEDIIDKHTLTIMRPISENKFTYLSIDQVIKIVFFRKEGIYVFDAKVIDRVKSGEAISAIVSAISPVERLQRRGYFRLGLMVSVTIEYMIDGRRIRKRFDTIDISGGGIKILCADKMNVGDEFELDIGIPGIEGQVIKGRIVRNIPSSSDNKINDIGVEFIDVAPKIRQTIIQYIFIKQRIILKKGIK